MPSIYTIGLYLLSPVIAFILYRRSRSNAAYRARLGEHFGIYSQPQHTSDIWIHAASMGETKIASPVIQALLTAHPGLQITVTTNTPTGADELQRSFGHKVHHYYLPLDFPFVLKRFFKQASPQCLLLIEKEVWPNMLRLSQKRNMPTAIINARLLESSLPRYKRMRAILTGLTWLTAQENSDTECFLRLGLDAQRCHTVGNIKFDYASDPTLATKAAKMRKQWGETRPILVAASTHAGEDEIMLSAFRDCLKAHPDLLLIIAPRHQKRFDDVASLCQQQGFTVSRRSKQEPVTSTTQIYLADTMGELNLFYAVCDIAFVGGSFAPAGGHNLLEPAQQARPIITGPELFNTKSISEALVAAEALIICDSPENLGPAIQRLLDNSTLAKQMGQRAFAYQNSNRGALAKNVELIEQHCLNKER